MDKPTVLTAARDGLREIGYVPALIREGYAFSDVLSDNSVEFVDLAAFSHDPPSYRSACMAMAVTEREDPDYVRRFNSIGAPQMLTVRDDETKRWKMTPVGDPQLLETFPTHALRTVLREHRQQWSPDVISRAKLSSIDTTPYQLDFYDEGLLPAIETVL